MGQDTQTPTRESEIKGTTINTLHHEGISFVPYLNLACKITTETSIQFGGDPPQCQLIKVCLMVVF